MPCYRPLQGYRHKDGKVRFKRPLGESEEALTIACGQCNGCRLERSRQWSVRMMHEAQMNDRNCFLTLSYNDDNLPADEGLNPKHFRDFCKRLRKNVGPFRYYHCGEYGSKKMRPHYHAAIFGLDFMQDRVYHKTTEEGHTLYISKVLDFNWRMGHCQIGNLSFASAGYVAQYIMKKQTGPRQTRAYEFIDRDTGEVIERTPPYASMSTRPGLGASWLAKYQQDVYPSDEVVLNGKKSRPPVYYDRLLEKENPELLAQLKLQRVEQGSTYADNNTTERLRVRERSLFLKQKRGSTRR